MAFEEKQYIWQSMLKKAEAIAANRTHQPIDDAVRQLGAKRLLRTNLACDPIRLARGWLPTAVTTGINEEKLYLQHGKDLAEWKKLRGAADDAVHALDALTSEPKFTIGSLVGLADKFNRSCQSAESDDEPNSSNQVAVDPLRYGKQLQEEIVKAQAAAGFIARWAAERTKAIGGKKTSPGDAFRRGFTLEMMKVYYLITGRQPSSKRSEEGNPFANFADSAMNSVSETDMPSCAHVVRSVLSEFKSLVAAGALWGIESEVQRNNLSIIVDDSA